MSNGIIVKNVDLYLNLLIQVTSCLTRIFIVIIIDRLKLKGVVSSTLVNIWKSRISLLLRDPNNLHILIIKWQNVRIFFSFLLNYIDCESVIKKFSHHVIYRPYAHNQIGDGKQFQGHTQPLLNFLKWEKMDHLCMKLY